MAVNTNFWLVAGAAAPIIALANQVTLTESWGALEFFREAERRNPKGPIHGVARTGRIATGRSYLVGYVNTGIQALALTFALSSLEVGRDVVSLTLVGLMEALGLVAVFFTALYSGFAARRRVLLDIYGWKLARPSENAPPADGPAPDKPDGPPAATGQGPVGQLPSTTRCHGSGIGHRPVDENCCAHEWWMFHTSGDEFGGIRL